MLTIVLTIVLKLKVGKPSSLNKKVTISVTLGPGYLIIKVINYFGWQREHGVKNNKARQLHKDKTFISSILLFSNLTNKGMQLVGFN